MKKNNLTQNTSQQTVQCRHSLDLLHLYTLCIVDDAVHTVAASSPVDIKQQKITNAKYSLQLFFIIQTSTAGNGQLAAWPKAM